MIGLVLTVRMVVVGKLDFVFDSGREEEDMMKKKQVVLVLG